MTSDRYKKIIEHSKEGLLLVDGNGLIEMVNPRLVEMFGYETGEELMGKKVEILIPFRLGKKHVGHRSDYHKNPTVRTMGIGKKLSARRKDDSEFPVEVSLSHFQEDGELKIIAFVVDITKRAEIEEELLRLNSRLENEVQLRTQEINNQNRLLRSIAQNFPKGNIYVINKDYQITWADGKLIREIGLTDQSLIGHSFRDRLPSHVKPIVLEKLEKLFAGETIKYELQDKSRYLSIYGVPLEELDNEVKTALLVELDTTSEKMIELEMQANLEQEKKLNEMKSRFVSMASHEFRTPLSTIVSSATLIGKYQTEEQQNKREKHINRIKRSVSNLTVILNDFLSLEKLESGVIDLNLTAVSLPDFIEELIEEFSVIKGADQTFEKKVTLDQSIIQTDPGILKNCCLNLLSNAAKYSGNKGNITLEITSTDDHLNIRVVDDGIGIPRDEQAHLFTRFFRAKNVTNIQGTGLGLNIVKRYVELMSGTISFESELEEGTTFTIEIPHRKS